MTSLADSERATLPKPARRTWALKAVGRALRYAEASHLRLCAVLVLFSLACFLPGFASLQPMDRDEPRFAQASKQMLESGDFVDIRFQDEARHKKPVGIYWLQSAAVARRRRRSACPTARTTIALYRMPSLLGAMAAVLLTYWAALAFVAPARRFLAAALMAASMLLMVEARLAKTDAVLAACAVAAMHGRLARAYLRRDAAGSAARDDRAVLARASPPASWSRARSSPMFVGLAAVVLCRSASARGAGCWRCGRGWALPLCSRRAALVRRHRLARAAAPSSPSRSARTCSARSASGQESHWAPPGLYLVAFFGTFWPRRDPRRDRGAVRWSRAARATRWPSCSPGSCRPGSSSRRCRQSCRITCCRSIRPSPS